MRKIEVGGGVLVIGYVGGDMLDTAMVHMGEYMGGYACLISKDILHDTFPEIYSRVW